MSNPPSNRELALWAIHRIAASLGGGNRAAAAEVRAEVSAAAVTAAANHLIAAHPQLRRTFAPGESAGGPYLIDLPPDQAQPETSSVSLARGSQSDHDGTVQSLLGRLANEPLAAGRVLLRVAVIRSSGRSIIAAVAHELIVDDVELLLAELLGAIPGLSVAGIPAPADRPAWASSAGSAPGGTGSPHFEEESAMSIARPSPPMLDFVAGQLTREPSQSCDSALQMHTRRHDATATAVLTALFVMLLRQHGAGPRVAVGTTGRDRQPMTIRVDPEEHKTFADLVAHVDEAIGRADTTVPARVDPARWWKPEHRYAINVREDDPLEGCDLAGEPVTRIPVPPGTTTDDLRLSVRAAATGVGIAAVYRTALYEAADVDAFLDRYDHLLRHVEGGTPTEVPLLTRRDRAITRSATDDGPTRTNAPGPYVPDLVLAQARRTPDAPAIDDTSYAELVARAVDVRDTLTAAGVRTGDVVAVHGDRGPALASALLGTWLAGAAYLPLGEGMTAARMHRQLAVAGVDVVLQCGVNPPPATVAQRSITMPPPGPVRLPQSWPAGIGAYVLFTSGSTGNPKGVLVPHGALANLISDMTARLPVRASDRVLWSTAVTFDISALELWAPLTVGGWIRPVGDRTLLVPDDLLDVLDQDEIDIVQGTPTLWRHLTTSEAFDDSLRGRLALVGGEPFPAALARRLLSAGAQVRNMYGPTETTIWSTVHQVTEPVADPVLIGRPISNTTVQVIGEHGQPVFPGTPGELHIGGAGVAVGYIGDPVLTAARFVTGPAGRCYRTGDRVRQRSDGALEFLGRTDRQLKINGHRIELADVEAVLASHSLVRDAAVVTVADPAGRPRLAAAVTVTGPPDEGTVALLRRHAADLLPRPTVPAPIVVLDRIPVTANGKVDYAGVSAAIGAQRGAPQTPVASPDPRVAQLTSLWEEVIGRHGVTPATDFFHHGGTVAQALALASRVETVLGRTVSPTAILTAPTIEAVLGSAFVEEGTGS
ncbi:non-ribosomal peptide synthetase [Micromonospora sp. WMMA1976]|uniref:non-ribosomal peptide synthetase n=1 Tax=Micromonospora sp. WMMA1976 TaxID=3014995 RepID=UPI00248B000C|nr:non-ribosomal peptide synthetase [Micromonospora sp. WMMA1976]WBC01106.1 amino acid adenylation domain-containing protein [Micromonospora sp. WMMA1976]